MMKFIPFFLLLLPLGLSSQITLSQLHVPAPGDTLSYARDTIVSGIDIGVAGPNQIWDFTQLEADENYQLIASDIASDTSADNYPGANLIVTTEQVKTFIQSSDTAVYILGGGIPEAAAFGLEVVRFQPPQKIFQFPATYGSVFNNVYGVAATVDGSIFLPGVDSIRVVRRATATVEIDAYGTVKTPFNSYESLRQKTVTFNLDSLFFKSFGLWAPLTVDTSTDIQYQWLSAESKGNLVTVYLDTQTGAIDEVEYFVDINNAGAPLAAFTFEDQGAGSFAFSDQSGNLPASWQWTFGDGGSSDEQNPVYTYTVAGDYQVCLTAGNTIGTDQFCQSITVDLVNGLVDRANLINTLVRPNPADQWVLIESEGPGQATLILSLFNGQGQRVVQRQFNGSVQLDVSALPAGIYSYFLNSKDSMKWSSGKVQISR